MLAAGRAAYTETPVEDPDGAPCIRIRLVDDAPGTSGTTPRAALPHRDRLVLHGGGVDAEADAARGVAEARVTASALASRWFRESVLDHLGLFLVTGSERIPLHAAAVVREGTALLVAGPSGVGKSSVTYAAMRAGWRVISDDAVFVQRAPAPRLWSMPRPIHLPISATRHFPELADAERVARPDGRAKIAVALAPERRAPVPWTGRVALCLVSPGGAAVGADGSPPAGEVVRLGLEEAIVELRATLQGGFHRFEHRLADCVGAATSAGCWRVPRGAHPYDLLRRLDEVLESIA